MPCSTSNNTHINSIHRHCLDLPWHSRTLNLTLIGPLFHVRRIHYLHRNYQYIFNNDHASRKFKIPQYDSMYQTAIASVALSRYNNENVSDLGPSMLSRILEVHDFLLLLVPLVEEPPWNRRRSIEKRNKNEVSTAIVWEKLDNHNENGRRYPPRIFCI